jgi:hypothetical protein
MDDSNEEYHNTNVEVVENDTNSNKRSSDSDMKGIFSTNLLIQTEENLINSDEKISFLGISSDSQISIIINIICSAIGGSCFNFPFIIEKLGLPLTLIIFILVMISIYYTIDLLRRFIIDTKYFSFALMTEKIIGSNWMKVYVICSLILYLSIEINYISEIFTIVSKLIGISGKNDYIKIIVYFIITILFEVFICSYSSNIKKIHIISFFSIIFFLVILISVIVLGLINLANEAEKLSYENLIATDTDNNLDLFLFINSYSIVYIYGYSYHCSFPTLLGNFQNNLDEKNSRNVQIISFIIIGISYLLITFFGYLVKSDVPEILFIKDESLENTVFQIIFKIIICLFEFTVISLRFIVIRDNFTTLFGKQNMTFIKDLITTFIILLFCNIVAYLTNENEIGFSILSNFMQLFGGIFGVIICYALPVIIYIGANGRRKVKSIIGYILTGIFLFVGIVSVCHSVYGIFHNNDYLK